MKSNNRAETGAMRFGSDWTGTFLRGDDAYAYAASLRRILKDVKAGDTLDQFDMAILEGLAAALEASREDGWLPENEDVQMMKDYRDCARLVDETKEEINSSESKELVEELIIDFQDFENYENLNEKDIEQLLIKESGN